MPTIRVSKLDRRAALLWLLAVGAGPAWAQLKSGDNPDASPNWLRVRAPLFQDRPIRTADADTVIQLDAPARAEDAAIVPIALRAQFAQSAQRSIERVWLLIDNNPSPVAAVFTFTPASGRADIETRVRIDEYTFVRAIAETNDGRLYMATRFVKASGGCSAPPGKDAQEALATLGKMRLRVDNPQGSGAARGGPLLAQLMISHPNHSGLAMDQLTRQYTPPHFVRRINVSYNGKPVMTADVDFSLSENPNLRFHFNADGGGELKAEIVDSNELKFETSTRYSPT
jgi:sulfur-oxidizing protein SoxY